MTFQGLHFLARGVRGSATGPFCRDTFLSRCVRDAVGPVLTLRRARRCILGVTTACARRPVAARVLRGGSAASAWRVSATRTLRRTRSTRCPAWSAAAVRGGRCLRLLRVACGVSGIGRRRRWPWTSRGASRVVRMRTCRWFAGVRVVGAARVLRRAQSRFSRSA